MSLSGQFEREFLAFGLKRFLVRFKRDVTGWVVLVTWTQPYLGTEVHRRAFSLWW